MNNRTKSSFIAVGVALSLFSTHAEANIFPDIPGLSEPTSSYPGYFPNFNPPVSGEQAKGNVPQIAEWTRSNDPGDQMALTGENLAVLGSGDNGTNAIAYCEKNGSPDVLAHCVVSNLVGRHCSITLANTLYPNTIYLMWLENESGYGEPIRINNAEAWWVGPQRIKAGEEFSIYGRNLTGVSNKCYALLNGEWLPSTSANPYKADFVAPASLADDTYTIYAHNGYGRKYGWSEPLDLEIWAGYDWNDDTNTWINVMEAPYNAVGDGSTDNYDALHDAIYAADAGDTVYFPAGEYAIASSMYLHYPKDIRLLGDGPTNSIITTASNYTGISGALGVIDIRPTRCEINGIGFISGPHLDRNFFVSVAGKDSLYTNCIFDDSDSDSSPANVRNVVYIGTQKRLRFENCKVTAYKGAVITGSGVTIKDSDFRGWGDSQNTYLVAINGSDKVSITGCTGRPDDPSDYTQADGWTQGRFIYMNGGAGGMENVYIADNETFDMAPRYNWDVDLYGGRHMLTTKATASTTSPNTVTVPGLDSLYDGTNQLHLIGGEASFQVISGTGTSGRTYEITSVNETTGVIGIDAPWHETVGAPASGSTLAIKSTKPGQPHQNAGEQILGEGQLTQWRGVVSTATSNTVTLPGSYPYIEEGTHCVTVMDGKGMGQTRRVASVSTNVVTITEPWNVIPDSSSIISGGAFNRRFVIYNNVFEGLEWVSLPVDRDNRTYPYEEGTSATESASTAVSFYGAHIDCVVARNTITKVGDGITNYGFLDKGDFDSSKSVVMPNYFNLFEDNVIDGARRVIVNVTGRSAYASATNQADVAILASVWRDNKYANISTTSILVEESIFSGVTIEQSIHSGFEKIVMPSSDGHQVLYNRINPSAQHRIEVYDNESFRYYVVADDAGYFKVEEHMMQGDWFRIRIQEKDGENWIDLHEEWLGRSPAHQFDS